ncbi:hypothetical protein Glo7428_3151 [Gloeocapsa sp. PCC 7428]|uniref:hypothetical protein n=1 Tax=Gloeocapsa sp. PCC 7428 TaxID=1173026 RepID=UPI0002A5FEB2|nr:hypothetical protein [Gloeocapsa sp. PCC 7428]AFZ31638.1 hypothetical protein Glo7428_3151 [Gloeocapsa sp. PCC 7428]
MAREAQLVPMNIGSGRTVFVKVPAKVIDYFGMEAAVVAGTTTQTNRERRAHTRKRYVKDQLSGTTEATPVAVGVARWVDVGGRSRRGRAQGKLIIVPTEIPHNPNDLSRGYRMVSLRVPGNATNYSIAMWINTTFTTHKPAYFLTPSKQKYPVAVPNVADPNPGNRDGVPTAPATPNP